MPLFSLSRHTARVPHHYTHGVYDDASHPCSGKDNPCLHHGVERRYSLRCRSRPALWRYVAGGLAIGLAAGWALSRASSDR